MESLQIAVVEKSEIAFHWVKLGFKSLAEKVKVELHQFVNINDFIESLIDFNISILGSTSSTLTLSDSLGKAFGENQKGKAYFYICNNLTSQKQADLQDYGFVKVWEKTHTSSSDIERDILDTISVPYLIFDKESRNKIEKVLVVDDALISRKVACKLLTKFDLDLFEAGNGTQGVKCAFEEHPQMIFMDFEMPEMNGLEATKKLRYKGSESIIVGLSAHNKFDVADAAKAAGMSALIEKPVKKDTIESLLKYYSID